MRTASQKTGMEMPIRAKIMVTLSNAVYCLVAEMIPMGVPITAAMKIEMAASSRVYGTQFQIRVITASLVA